MPGLVLGTAGHIDHGKSALVLALTGVDPDRLPEEKARGITIDLGFAELDLGEGLALSVVDVPGHERLVRTMVAGATGIDLLMLVVAADEGVMPQTREHVAICDLLGIDRGVVALTKTDLVDEEMIELASEDVRDLLSGTSIGKFEVVPVSSQTGDGIDTLRDTLRALASGSQPRTPRAGPPRLPIDRIFAIRGFGTVVTGTLTGSTLEVGDPVEIQPGGRRGRIRGLQTHGVARKLAEPGSRCAVNLQGLEVSDLERGEVVSHPEALTATESADVELWWLPSAAAAEGSVSIEFLSGTAERRAHLAPIGGASFAPGAKLFARLHVDDGPLPLLPGDRFIARGFARNESAGATVGGGIVLDIAPPHRRRSDPALVRELEILTRRDLQADLRERIHRSGFSGVLAASLARETGTARADLDAVLESLASAGEVQRAGTHFWIGSDSLGRMQARLLAGLDRYHAAEPLRPGMPRAALRGQLPENVPNEIGEVAFTRLEEAGEIEVHGDLVRRAGHAPTLDAEAQATTERILAEARAAGLDPPSPRDWGESLGVSPDRFRNLVAHLERGGELVRAPGDLWFDKSAIEELRQRVVSHLQQHGEIDTAAYKNLTGTSRRTTVPLMELLDELHVTRRKGDVRILRGG
ncbi:MAG: selenocysteine-specific translation elongation factor [Myxococcota bacterium]|nr:selenocysteine-specific translation elongation factor [Myxococcota bacterium]